MAATVVVGTSSRDRRSRGGNRRRGESNSSNSVAMGTAAPAAGMLVEEP